MLDFIVFLSSIVFGTYRIVNLVYPYTPYSLLFSLIDLTLRYDLLVTFCYQIIPFFY